MYKRVPQSTLKSQTEKFAPSSLLQYSSKQCPTLGKAATKLIKPKERTRRPSPYLRKQIENLRNNRDFKENSVKRVNKVAGRHLSALLSLQFSKRKAFAFRQLATPTVDYQPTEIISLTLCDPTNDK